MARTNVLVTAKRIRRQLHGAHSLEEAVLAFNVTDTAIELTFDTTIPKAVRVGTVLGLELELVRVRSKDEINQKVSVTRGYLDSIAVAHTAGTIIDVAPRFSMIDIVEAMQSELDSWGIQLYRTLSQTFSVDPSAETLELPTAWEGMLGICEMTQSEDRTFSTSKVWPRIDGRLIRGEPTQFTGAPTSGLLVRFHEAIRTGQVYIVVAMPFNSSLVTTTADLLTDVGLEKHLLDILELGVKRRLMVDSDSGRTNRQAQDEPRQASETPIGSMVSIAQLGLATYRQRRSEAESLLRRRYPIRIT